MHIKLNDIEQARIADGRTVSINVDGETVTIYPPERHREAPVRGAR